MKKYLLFASVSIAAFTASAQESSDDSLKTYQAAEVVVTATRSPISKQDAPSPTEVLDSTALQRTNGGSVADALESFTGVLMKEQGGGGALKTASLRGSASEHVLVLLDGKRYTGFQNGVVDFSLLPLDNVSRIEILHGGSSALYGDDALGGVINILTRPPGSDLRLNANGSWGSYDYRRYSVRMQGGLEGIGIAGGFSSERGQDDYPFKIQRPNLPDSTLTRSDADFRREESFVNGEFRPDDRSSVTVSLQNILATVGVPGDMAFSNNSSLARQNDRDVNAVLGYRDNHQSGLEFDMTTGLHYSLERYSSPGYYTYYKNTYFTIDPNARIALASTDRLIIGSGFANGILESFDFGIPFTRRQISLYTSNEFVKEFEGELCDHLSLYQTLRYDDFSDVGNALTPKIGMNLRIVKAGDVRVRASYGTSFRAPSFNDLYYPGFSNPGLRPEHSQSFDFGLLADGIFYGEHSAEVTYFNVHTVDRILLDPVTYIPVNIGKTVSQGIESSYSGRLLAGAVEIGLNYTFTEARKKNSSSPSDSTFDKQLVFIPQSLFKGSLTVHLEPVTISLFRIFTGVRFISEDNSQSLPAYSLTNVNITARMPMGSWKLTFKGEISNMYDVSYRWFPGYPMPGRTFRLSVGIDY